MGLGDLLLKLIGHLALTGLPLAAAILCAARLGVRRVPVLLAIGLAASGGIGLLGFWTFYATPLVGESFAYLVLFGSILLCAWSLYGGRLERSLLRVLSTPLLLWALGSGFLLFLGFVHGGIDTPLATATTRFSHPLPGDNAIPSFFTDWFFANGHRGVPPVFPGEWLSSDRPPLQVGYALTQRPFGWDASGLDYQVLGVLLQQLWIVGLWALLSAARVGRTTRALAMVAVLVSDLAIVNGFFVWPKLLPAALLLAVAALVITPLWLDVRRKLWAAGLIGALCALAMMGHGSSVFGIVPLAAVAAYRGLPSVRWIGVGLAVGIALMAPWSAFQKYDDPPGNRLAKWTLAGVVEIDGRSTSEAVFDAYGEAGVDGTLDNKYQNFLTMAGGEPALETVETAVDAGGLLEGMKALRFVFFIYLLPSLGLLLLAPLLMVVRLGRQRDPAEWRFALTCCAVFVLGAIVWGLVVFGNVESRAVIHFGTYLLPILAICGAVAGLRAVLPRFGFALVALDSLLSLALYVPAFDSPPGSAYSLWAAVIAALFLAAFPFVAFHGEAVPEPLEAGVPQDRVRETAAGGAAAAAGAEPS
ncbi:MAG TPA: hypothetical protein VHP56_06280 [Solirubrobacterales bacterium]|jgi:hypothetical protein|nr:hypothetical protein [Solirubrobacterales bacterium]